MKTSEHSRVRPAGDSDYGAIVAIYNHYIAETPITFDIEPYTVESRAPWFAQFGETGRYQLLVAESRGIVIGYAGSMPYRAKRAYETTVEATIYLHPEHLRQGAGRLLYTALFARLEREDVHRILAGITLPNEASIGLHEALGFRLAGVFHEVGRKFGRYWDVAWYERTN